MKIELIKYPTEADWMFCKECTLVTVGKKAINPPTFKWKRDILEAKHSPIRELRFAFKLIETLISKERADLVKGAVLCAE